MLDKKVISIKHIIFIPLANRQDPVYFLEGNYELESINVN